MAAHNKVIWSEGLFIKPQHFQQQQRHIEYLLDNRVNATGPYQYGINHIVINQNNLQHGNLMIESASGIMPDGTVFYCPNEDILPAPLHIEDNRQTNQIVYLAIPLRNHSIRDVGDSDNAAAGRYQIKTSQVYDVESVASNDDSTLALSTLNMRLMLEEEDRSAFACLPITRITQKDDNKTLQLDDKFIPCHLNSLSISLLKNSVTEIMIMLRERAKNIAERLGATSQDSIADVSDFMLLQALNRLHPQLAHMNTLTSLHPEKLYEFLTIATSELATFTNDERLPPKFASYQHDTPHAALTSVFEKIKKELNTVLEPRAVHLPLENGQYGIKTATLYDSHLFDTSNFVIAVHAQIPTQELHTKFINQTKVAAPDKISHLISRHLPGIPLVTLPLAPRQLPFHDGYSYFELDKTGPAWKALASTNGFSFHISGDFPGLKLQFWAVRGSKS